MYKSLLVSISLICALTVKAETITIVTPVSPSHSNISISLKLIDKANFLQSKYNFTFEYRPGANGLVAFKYADANPANRLVAVNPAFVTNVGKGLIKESDYVPVSASGDVCWALISNIGDTASGVSSLSKFKGKEITVGGNGIGNAAHITALMLGEKYGFRVKYVVFKSNFDAVVNMVGDNGVNMALESVTTYSQFKEKQPNLQMLGLNCPVRSTKAPHLKTLQEQGIKAPIIFNMVMANRTMPEEKRKEISAILDQATMAIGEKEYAEVGGLHPPVFQNVRVEEYANSRIRTMKDLAGRYQSTINHESKTEAKLALNGKQ